MNAEVKKNPDHSNQLATGMKTGPYQDLGSGSANEDKIYAIAEACCLPYEDSCEK